MRGLVASGLGRTTRTVWLALVAWAGLAMLGGCAHRGSSTPPPSALRIAQGLMHDSLFAPPATRPDRDAVLAPTPQMQAHAEKLRRPPLGEDSRHALLHALFRNDDLRLNYDTGRTRDAATTYQDRAGNCLSLVLMTAAFAKMLDMPVSYQAVVVEEAATRAGGLLFLSGHVNILLSQRAMYRRPGDDSALLVDFLPGEQVAGYRTVPLVEHQVLSLYMNNRAAELLAEGRIADAYAHAREALLIDPVSSSAANTLAVVYSRGGHGAAAEAAWRRALVLSPDSTSVLANLSQHLERSGRAPEAAPLASRLAQLQPVPPLHHLEQGRLALDRGELSVARDLFRRELRRQPYQAEVHYWLAVTNARLGDGERAARDLAQAVMHSTTPVQQQLYSSKLARLRDLLPAVQ
ncbi:MAG: tetratricopeptide repeat protein [Rubrivivax sp.]|nr:tetratricopeptide repeat protein [Rubrivivax sp.]